MQIKKLKMCGKTQRLFSKSSRGAYLQVDLRNQLHVRACARWYSQSELRKQPQSLVLGDFEGLYGK